MSIAVRIKLELMQPGPGPPHEAGRPGFIVLTGHSLRMRVTVLLSSYQSKLGPSPEAGRPRFIVLTVLTGSYRSPSIVLTVAIALKGPSGPRHGPLSKKCTFWISPTPKLLKDPEKQILRQYFALLLTGLLLRHEFHTALQLQILQKTLQIA